MLSDLHNSLKINDQGYSFRKLLGLVAVIVASHATFRYGDDKTVVALAMVWLCFALLCLGLVTSEEIITGLAKLKNGRTEEPQQNTGS